MSASRNAESETPGTPAEVPAEVPDEAPTVAKRPPLPKPDTSGGFDSPGRGKVRGGQSGNRSAKQFARRKH